jgi:cell division protein FtsL
MGFIIVLLIFAIIGLSFYIEFKNIEIEKLKSQLVEKEDHIFELTKELNDLVS